MPIGASPNTAAIKSREALSRLREHGIEASRNSGWDRGRGAPDAFLASVEGQAWLVKIWTGDSLQPRLFSEMPSADSQPEAPLEESVGALADWTHSHATAIGGVPSLLILAPLLEDEAFQEGRAIVLGATTVHIAGKRVCAKPERFAAAIRRMSAGTAPLPTDTIARWRAVAVPEVAIDAPAHVRRRIDRNPGAPVAPLLLDYDQERCARLDLDPVIDLREVSGDLRVRLITGVAGCGKTLVLLHRAALLARHFPRARVLIVSHNRPLIADLERRLRKKGGHHTGQIECRTFLQWLRSVSPPRGTGDLLDHGDTRLWIESHRQNGTGLPALARHSAAWLAEEIGWMFDHGHAGEDYLTVERKGRGVPLTEPQRREMLALVRNYRAYLRTKQASDWSEWPLSAWESWNERSTPPPLYDHLLIDEAQFFAPIWLELLRRVLRPGGHLFLCADPTQGFLKRRQSWSGLGLDVRHRSHRLERPYRSTRAILTFAERFYRRRLPDDDEPLNLPSPGWLESIPAGQAPAVVPVAAGEDQLRRLIDELRAFRDGGGSFPDVLVLIAGRKVPATVVAERLAHHFGPAQVGEMKSMDLPDTALGIAHLMAATGLERPIVFLLGIDELIAEENDPTLEPEARQEKIRDHTRQIYVGLTRAIERLVIFAKPGLFAK